MVARIIACMVLMLLVITSVTYAQDDPDSWTNNYVFNRGIFGVVYKVVEVPLRVFEYVLFGRYGVCSLDDYFRFNRICADKKPEY